MSENNCKPYQCPSCGSRISHIHVFVLEENRYELEHEEDGKWVHWYGQESIEASEKSADAECPECGKKIGDHWSETWEDLSSWALKILNSILVDKEKESQA